MLCRCKKAEAVEGKKVCAECRVKLTALSQRAHAACSTPMTATHRTCTTCKEPKTFDHFTAARTKVGLQAKCRPCRSAQVKAIKHSKHGVQPFRPRDERDGEYRCTRCSTWWPKEVFYLSYKDDDKRGSWCKLCWSEHRETTRRIGTGLCACGQAQREPGEDACTACLDQDGRTLVEGTMISALRVLGGESQMAAIVEDIGGDFHEDPKTGSGYRRAYRGVAALRARGCVETRHENEDAKMGSTATHRLRRAR